ncbi:MAG: hypothetical protein EOP45_14175 [Sphingobacteriaceae bacterium]|nr:MAG: hypothetical protein EOP45_14175 [Sphingobacteriaceae bacterium]
MGTSENSDSIDAFPNEDERLNFNFNDQMYQRIRSSTHHEINIAAKKDIDTKLKEYISSNITLDFETLRKFCSETKQMYQQELELIQNKRRRCHESISSARKLIILDDKQNPDYTSSVIKLPVK